MACSPEIARENGRKGGRPPTAPTRLSRAKAVELMERSQTPLDIMIDNMVFWCERSREMELMLNQLRDDLDRAVESGDDDEAKDLRKKALDMLRIFLSARENAQSCAVDAAPYMHPRLQSIELRERPDGKPREITSDMSVQEAAEAWADEMGRRL